MIRFQCPQCRGMLEAPDRKGGEKFDCPGCGQRLQIPRPPSVPARNKTMLGALSPPFPSSQQRPASPAAPAKSFPMRCPACSAIVQVPRSLAGQVARCPTCGNTFRVKIKGETENPLPVTVIVQTAPPATQTQPGDREFLREVTQLFLFALAISGIGGAFTDFFAPISPPLAPLSLIFSVGLAAAALLCLILFPIFRRQGLGLAAFCLLCVALGFGSWWGLAESRDSRDRGFLASRLPTIRDWQKRAFPTRVGGDSGEGKDSRENSPDPTEVKRDRPALLDCRDGVEKEEVQKAQRAWAEYLGRNVEEEVEIANGVKITFVLIPPGKFHMGSPSEEHDFVTKIIYEGKRPLDGNNPPFDALIDEKQHEVTLTEPFDLGKTEVTQAQYKALGLENPSHFKGDNLPVEMVSWKEAKDWAEKLTKKRGDKYFYRLPTEAEWEYACREGRSSSHPFGIGSGRALSSREANFNGDFPYGGADKGPCLRSTCAVASYPANALGLHDMYGNVREWCEDWYGPYPSGLFPVHGSATNPTGPGEGWVRSNRGGWWNSPAWQCRAAHRFPFGCDRSNLHGFRLVRSLGLPKPSPATGSDIPMPAGQGNETAKMPGVPKAGGRGEPEPDGGGGAAAAAAGPRPLIDLLAKLPNESWPGKKYDELQWGKANNWFRKNLKGKRASWITSAPNVDFMQDEKGNYTAHLTIGDPGPQNLFGDQYVPNFYMAHNFGIGIKNWLKLVGLNQEQAERLREFTMGQVEISFRIESVHLSRSAWWPKEKHKLYVKVDEIAIKKIRAEKAEKAEDGENPKLGNQRLKGTIMCGKCTLKLCPKCTNVLQVNENGRSINYFIEDQGIRAPYHKAICPKGKTQKAEITGTIYTRDGKKWIKPSKDSVKISE